MGSGIGNGHPREAVGGAGQRARIDDLCGLRRGPLEALDGLRGLRAEGEVDADGTAGLATAPRRQRVAGLCDSFSAGPGILPLASHRAC